jgi:HK97 family phage major capsid protein
MKDTLRSLISRSNVGEILMGVELSGANKELCAEGARQAKQAGAPTVGNIQLPWAAVTTRGLSVGDSDPAGGYTVATDHQGFIDMFAPHLRVQQLGATMLTGLSGSVDIPSQASGATAEWEEENSEGAESSLRSAKSVCPPTAWGHTLL